MFDNEALQPIAILLLVAVAVVIIAAMAKRFSSVLTGPQGRGSPSYRKEDEALVNRLSFGEHQRLSELIRSEERIEDPAAAEKAAALYRLTLARMDETSWGNHWIFPALLAAILVLRLLTGTEPARLWPSGVFILLLLVISFVVMPRWVGKQRARLLRTAEINGWNSSGDT